MTAAIDPRDTMVKPVRSSARAAHAEHLFCAANSRDKSAAAKSLEIQCKIRPDLLGFLQPRQHTLRRSEPSEVTAWQEVNMVHVRIPAEQGSEFRTDEPGDLSARVRFTKQCNCWKRVNYVTKPTRLDD